MTAMAKADVLADVGYDRLRPGGRRGRCRSVRLWEQVAFSVIILSWNWGLVLGK